MGLYDYYEGIQLKIGNFCMAEYRIGDVVYIPDGVYVAPTGAVVIKDKKLLMTTENVQNKWGGKVDVENDNPLAQFLAGYCAEDYEAKIFALTLERDRLVTIIWELNPKHKHDHDYFHSNCGLCQMEKESFKEVEQAIETCKTKNDAKG